MHEYPTTEEVKESVERNPPSTQDVEILKEWKAGFYTRQWKSTKDIHKKIALGTLLSLLWLTKNEHLENPEMLNITWDNLGWRYTPATNTITGTNPSIISALHELGHALYGSSELEACTYSTSLFKAVFPREYGRLEWDGHMLRKPLTTPN